MSTLRSSRGYTLIELMMVVTIIGLLSSFAVPRYVGYIEKARVARCIAEIRYFEREIQAYYIDREQYPSSLLDLGRSFQNLLDPWGNQYQYFLIAGTKWAKNDGGGGKYYAKSNKTPDFVTIASESEKGFWSGSWFASEAWAQGNSGNAGGGPPTDPGNSGSAGGGPPTDPGNSGSAGGGPPTDPGNSGSAGGGNAGGNSGNAGGNSGGGNAGGNSGGGNAGGNSGGGTYVQQKPRQDRFLKPVTSDYDLYSMGPDGETTENLNNKKSLDDIIRASEGAYVGLAANF